MTMRCFKHDIEYGYGNCPQCEQERHNQKVEDLLERQHQELERHHQQAERQLRYQEDQREAQLYAERQENFRHAQESCKQLMFDLLPRIQKKYGNEFIAKFYLRIILFPLLRLNLLVIPEYIGKFLLPKMKEDEGHLILRQTSLIQKIVDEDQFERKQRNFLFSERDKIEKEKSDLGLYGGLVAGFLTALFFGGIFWLSVLIFPIVGVLASGLNRQANYELFLQRLQKSEQFAEKYTWYQNEFAESINLYECVSKGMPFVWATFDEWVDSGVTKDDVLSSIELEFSKGF